jgi:Outer membrane protein beta-barrel domain
MIRTKYLLTIVFATLSISAFSQKINWGLKFGGGIANQSVKNVDIISTNSTITLNVAGFVNYSLPNQWALQSGLGISNKGAEIVEDGITTTPKITYLDLPLNIAKKFNFPGLGMYYFGAGGYAARALSGKYKFETPNSVSSEKLEFGNGADVKREDYGLNFTTGLELNNHLLFDIRYELGLQDISTQPQRDTGTSYIHNRLLTVSLGYIFK